MQRKILSIIVPTYNKEKLIEKCLNSFCVEELRDDLEVIVIDDGSSDNSYEIILEYARQYPDIFVPIQKKNGGVGSVMNMGLHKAVGKYVKEVDADDWVDSAALIKLIHFLKNTTADIVVNPFQVVDDSGKKIREKYNKGFYFQKEYRMENVINKVLFSVQNITVRKEILEINKFVLNEDRYYIDMQLVESSVLYAKTCVLLSDSLYRYRVGQEEQSVNLNSYIKNKNSFYNQTILSLERLKNLTDEGVKYRYQKSAAFHYCVYMYAIYMMDLEDYQASGVKEFKQYIKINYPEMFDELETIKFVRRIHGTRGILFNLYRKQFIKKMKREIDKNKDAGLSVALLF